MSELAKITSRKSGLNGAIVRVLGYNTQDNGMPHHLRLEVVRATEPDWIGTVVCMHESHVQSIAAMPERETVTEGFNPDEWR